MTKVFVNRTAGILLCATLVILLAVRGIAPPLSRIDSDFPNYLTAAMLVAEHGNVGQLYDDSWFREQMRRYGFGRASEGQFRPFPPPTALLLVPLSRLQPLDALRVVTVVSVLCLICSIILLARILSWGLVDAAVFVLLSGYAAANTLRLGQPYILVSSSCILGYYALLKRRPFLAGFCFGIFSPIKYFPVVFLIYYAFRKEWKVVFGGATAILAVVLASIGVLGWKIHEDFLSSVLGNHLIGKLAAQTPFTASYQSFDSLFRRLFVFDEILNPWPLSASPALAPVVLVVTKASIFMIAIVALVRIARRGTASAADPSIGILGVLAMLLAPATATYHFVLLWLPVGLLVKHCFIERAPGRAYFVLGAYALMGFFPYGYVYRFEGHGGLTVLAYPRLFLLLSMFVACIYFVWNPAEPVREGRTHDSPVFRRKCATWLRIIR